MYILEEFAVVLLLSVVLTAFCGLAGLAGRAVYRLLSGGTRMVRRSRPAAGAPFVLSQWIVRARSMLRRAPEGGSSGPAAPLLLPAAGQPSWQHRTLPQVHFGHKLRDHTVAKIELVLWFLWVLVIIGLLMAVAAWVFRGRLAG